MALEPQGTVQVEIFTDSEYLKRALRNGCRNEAPGMAPGKGRFGAVKKRGFVNGSKPRWAAQSRVELGDGHAAIRQ
jgi:ribonuclease HI